MIVFPRLQERWLHGVAALAAAVAVTASVAAGFATPGGPEPGNLDAVLADLDADRPDLELLLSFGTSKGGSAGHLALAIRDDAGEPVVHSANFYADRDPDHARDHYTASLMVQIPRREYLYGTRSTLDPKAAFGLDFGEVYKRSLVGIRVFGAPPAERRALADYLARIDADYRGRATDTEYHNGEVRYDYLRLNCAKTIGSAFRYGAGYDDLVIDGKWRLLRRPLLTALNANVPTEMAMKLVEAWNKRGYRIDVVLYRKYRGSPHVDPLEPDSGTFGELPDRFPSVLSRDFRREAGEYEDYDNLYAMYLLRNLARAAVVMDTATGMLRIEARKVPMTYAEAVTRARSDAAADEQGYAKQPPYAPQGTRIGEARWSAVPRIAPRRRRADRGPGPVIRRAP